MDGINGIIDSYVVNSLNPVATPTMYSKSFLFELKNSDRENDREEMNVTRD